MSTRFVRQWDARYGIERRMWLVDVDIRHPTGERERVRRVSPIQTQRGAEAYERRLRAALLDPQRRRSEVPTFAAFAERWLQVYPHAAGNRPSTVREKEQHVRTHLIPAFGTAPLDQIHTEAIDTCLVALRAAGLREKTVRNILTTLKKLFATAVAWRVIERPPSITRVRVPEPAFTFLSADETAAVIDACVSTIDRAWILVAVHAGLRAGEILALRWTDFDGERIVVQRSRTRDIEGPCKSGRSRAIPVTASLRAALTALERRCAYVFADDRGRPWRLYDLHKRIGSVLGLAPVLWTPEMARGELAGRCSWARRRDGSEGTSPRSIEQRS